MTFIREAVRDRPVAIYAMDDTSPFQDYSGFNRTATAVGGTPVKHVSLISGTKFSQVFTSSVTGTFAAPLFHQGMEHNSFTLESWFRSVQEDNEQQILGNLGQMDGLTIDGNIVSFVIKFSTAPEARVTYDIQQGQSVYAVGVKVQDKISLFVNAKMVGELSLTAEQQADTYASGDSDLHSGATTGNAKVAIAGIGMYVSALDQTAISRHYLAGITLPDGEDVASSFKGDRIPISLSAANVFLDQWWTTSEDWNAAKLVNVSVINGQLRPQFDGDTSMAGQWMDNFALDAADGVSVYGVSFNWDGEGVVVQASLDGTTWETVQRGVNLTIIPPGFNPTDKELQLRVTFAGGTVNDTAFLDNLNAVGIKTNVTPAVGGRTVTYTAAYPEREHKPLSLHDNWGSEIASGGSIVISADTSDLAQPVRTVELWIKRTGANPTISATGTTYQNGVLADATLIAGQWTLMHIVAGANITGAVTINGPAQVGQVIVYDSALTDIQIAQIYSQYTLSSPMQVNDNSVITLAESASQPKIYAHDWAIQGAG